MDWTAHEKLEAPSDAFMHLSASNQYAALALLVYDMLLRFDTELNFVWGTNFRNTAVQWVFLFIRYFALAAKISTIVLGQTIDNPLNLGSYGLCMGYFVFQSIAGQLILTAVHFLLISRVRMLYSKRRYIVDTLFVFLILVETAAIIRICIVTFPHFQLGPHCAARIPAVDTVSYGVITVALQSAIICLTFLKYFQTTQHFRHHIAILSHLVRDGTWAFVVIVTCQILTVAYALPRYGSAGFTLIQSWLVTLLSCVGCRLIINLYELGRGDVLDTESLPLGVITAPELLYVIDSRERKADNRLIS